MSTGDPALPGDVLYRLPAVSFRGGEQLSRLSESELGLSDFGELGGVLGPFPVGRLACL